MASRLFTQFRLTLEKQVADIFAHITFGSTGAPTLDAKNSKGIVSVTRNSTGNYTLVFGTNASRLDTYQRLFQATHLFDATGNSGTAPAAPLMYLVGNSISTVGTASITVQFTNGSGTATDPASGEAVTLNFSFKNTSAP